FLEKNLPPGFLNAVKGLKSVFKSAFSSVVKKGCWPWLLSLPFVIFRDFRGLTGCSGCLPWLFLRGFVPPACRQAGRVRHRLFRLFALAVSSFSTQHSSLGTRPFPAPPLGAARSLG
ncbi:MAG TPA: hypothetical protein PLF96_13805, partial [Thermotogota bacterium]|nr:hypothetical protein [Thermotogota bacterium]